MSRLVPIDLIDPSPWAHLFPHPEDHIARLADDIRERGIQTPLHVYPTGERFELLAGHARVEAARRCGLTEVPVEVRSTLTTPEQRFEYVCKDNALRTDIDRKALARAILLEHPDWSDRRIAQCAGLSHPVVAVVRAEAEQAGEVETVSTSERVTADGKPTGRRSTLTAEERVRRYRERHRKTVENGKLPPGAAVVPTPEEPKLPMGEGASMEAVATASNRIDAPEGMGLIEAVRKAMAESGSAKDIATLYGWSPGTYAQMRYLVLLSDRDDLPDQDSEVVARCLSYLERERRIGPIWPEIEPIVTRIYGDSDTRRGVPPMRAEANRQAAFDRAYGALVTACSAARDLDVPHLPADRAREIAAELKEAEQSVRALRRKIEEFI